MKPFMAGVMPALAGVLLLFLSTGCKSMSVTHTQEIGGPRFAPTDPAHVELMNTRPTRPFVRIGEVRVEPPSPDVDPAKIEAALKKEAAKMGADAAVVIYDKTDRSATKYVGTWRTREPEPAPLRVIVAVAIKYQ